MANEIISIFKALKQKNGYLLEFHKINMQELDRLAGGQTDNLENFYYSRELLLNAINKLDRKISKYLKTNLTINRVQKKTMQNILNLKRKTVMSIIDQDLTILSLMNQIHGSKSTQHILVA